MKSVLISIRPEWCEKIASGEKTLEVRKTRPKLETPFKAYIYCTYKRPLLVREKFSTRFDTVRVRTREAAKMWGLNVFNGKVIGEFICDNVVNPFSVSRYWVPSRILNECCLSPDEIRRYANDGKVYAWHISDLKIYDAPKPLSEFVVEGDCDCMNCRKCSWLDKGDGFNVEDDCNLAYENIQRKDPLKPLFRPPQSWCYVEELSHE